MEMVRSMKSSPWPPRKKARKDKKSNIYFLVRGESWFVTELDKNNRTRKVDMQYPVKAYEVCFGSYGTLIYGLGGIASFVLGSGVKYLRSVFFYDTTDPKKGWIEGPRMISTRAANLRCTHRVVGGKLYVLGGEGFSGEVEESKVTYPWGECLDISSAPKEFPAGGWQALDGPEKSKTCDLDPYLYLSVHPSFLGSGKWEEFPPPVPLDFASLPMLSGEFDPQRHILFHVHSFHEYRTMYSMDIVVCYDVCKNQFFRFRGCFALSPYYAQQVIVEKNIVLAPASSYVFAARLFGGECDHYSSPPPWFFGSVQDMYPPTCQRLPPRHRCEFELLRIAPCEYATLWYDTHNEHKLRLSIFSVSLDSPPFEEGGIPLLPAKTHVSDQHVLLDLQQPNDVPRIVAAVAV